MEEKKTHVSAWIKNRNLKEISANMKLIDCESRSEYIDKAVEHYNGYLHNKNNEDYINQKVVKTMHGLIDSLERRLARQMFKQAVETAKVFWLVVKGFNIEPEDVDDFHNDCVEEVKRINGAIRYPFDSKGDDE